MIAQAESGIQQARQHRQQLLLLLGHDVHAGVLAQNVAQVSKGGHQVSLGAGLVGVWLFLCRWRGSRWLGGANQLLQRFLRLEERDVFSERRHVLLLNGLDRGVLGIEARAAHGLQGELGTFQLRLRLLFLFQAHAFRGCRVAQSCNARLLGLHVGVQCGSDGGRHNYCCRLGFCSRCCVGRRCRLRTLRAFAAHQPLSPALAVLGGDASVFQHALDGLGLGLVTGVLERLIDGFCRINVTVHRLEDGGEIALCNSGADLVALRPRVGVLHLALVSKLVVDLFQLLVQR